MTTLVSRFAVIALALAVVPVSGGVVSTPAQAQWQYDRFERIPGPHRWGPRCVDRITTRGSANLKLFGSGEKKKASAKAIVNWQEQVAEAFGPQYADWFLAKGNQQDCKMKGLKVSCTVSAHPCRR